MVILFFFVWHSSTLINFLSNSFVTLLGGWRQPHLSLFKSKFCKIFQNNFGSLKKVSIFAVPKRKDGQSRFLRWRGNKESSLKIIERQAA